MRFTPARVALSEERTRERLATWAARDLPIWITDSGPVGWFGLLPASEGKLELGFMIESAAWGQGLATAGAREIAQHAFRNLGVSALVARTDEENLGSQRVLAKLGFRYVETKISMDAVLGREIGTKFFEVGRGEFRAG